MPQTRLDATTSAGYSDSFVAKQAYASLPAHFTCPGLAGAETGTLQKQNGDESWSDYYVDGVLQQITVDNSGVVAYAPGVYRVHKSATSAAVPVEVSSEGNP